MITLTRGSLRQGMPRLRIALVFGLLAFVASIAFSFNEGIWGQLLRPALSEEIMASWWGSFSVAIVIFVIIFPTFYLLLGLPNKIQSWATWGMLACSALLFFYSFELSLEFIGRKLPFLISQGAVTTLYVSAISIVLAFIFALFGAVGKMSGIAIIQGVSSFYTSYFRGVPLLVQLFLIYLGLPRVGIIVPPIPAAIAALSMVYGAYMTEIFRSGIQSIPIGQWEASDALGMSRMRTFRLVVLPQAMRMIVPPTGNQFIAMLKDSSLVSVVGVWDIMFIARTQGRADFKILEMLITASLIYWIMSIVLEYIQARIERHYSKSTN